MLEALAVVFTILVTTGTTVAARWLLAKDTNRRPGRWDEVGGIALLAGVVGGFGLTQILGGLDGWDWGLAFLPGLMLGLFVALLPEMEGGLALIGWGSLILGGLFGMFLGAIGGLL
jgi:hypothetical protein